MLVHSLRPEPPDTLPNATAALLRAPRDLDLQVDFFSFFSFGPGPGRSLVMTMDPHHNGHGRPSSHPSGSWPAGVAVERVQLADRAARHRFVRASAALRAQNAVFRPSTSSDEAFRLDPSGVSGGGCRGMLGLLAHQAGRAVGCLVALRPSARESPGDGWFASFDFNGDPDVARALFAEGARWVQRGGATRWLGPVGLLPGEGCGVLVDGRVGRTVGELPFHPPEYSRWFAEAEDDWGMASEAGVWRVAVGGGGASHTDPARAGLKVVPIDLASLRSSNLHWEAFLRALPASTDPLVRLRGGPNTLRHEVLRTAADGGVCFVQLRGEVVGLGVLRPHCGCVSGIRLPNWVGRLRAWKQRRITRTGGLRIWRVGTGLSDPEPSEILLDALVDRAERLGFRELLVGPVPDTDSGTIAALRARGGRIDRRYRVYAQPLGQIASG